LFRWLPPHRKVQVGVEAGIRGSRSQQLQGGRRIDVMIAAVHGTWSAVGAEDPRRAGRPALRREVPDVEVLAGADRPLRISQVIPPGGRVALATGKDRVAGGVDDTAPAGGQGGEEAPSAHR